MLPSLFISHGSPMIALEDTEYTRYLKKLASELPKPKAIVMVSAHYESPIQRVGTAIDYRMIYDFGGFPRELSQIVYPAKGDKPIPTAGSTTGCGRSFISCTLMPRSLWSRFPSIPSSTLPNGSRSGRPFVR